MQEPGRKSRLFRLAVQIGNTFEFSMRIVANGDDMW
jgi:hypothetical protein